MERTKWVDRKFKLGIPEGWLPNLIGRLSGVSIRLKNMTKSLSDETLSKRLDSTWSIKEHIGHLADLEDLHIGRVSDFINRKEILQAADMSNKRTYRANHNEKTVTELIEAFELKRHVLISSLKDLDDKTQQFAALHPRLKIPMKPIDLAFFTAEHDDHHIASIAALLT